MKIDNKRFEEVTKRYVDEVNAIRDIETMIIQNCRFLTPGQITEVFDSMADLYQARLDLLQTFHKEVRKVHERVLIIAIDSSKARQDESPE